MRDTLVALPLVQLLLLGVGTTVSIASDAPCLTEAQTRQRLVDILHDAQPALWKCSDDALTMIPEPRPDIHTVGEIVSILNRRFKLEKLPAVRILRTDQDTVVVTVSDPAHLTQRMGTTGALCYLAEVTFSLTSIDGVDCIWLDVPEGEHAGPGRFGRASFPYLLPLIDPDEKK